MKKKIEIETWNRKEHFEFFKKFDEPFYHLNMNVACSAGLKMAKTNKHSLFAWYFFNAMQAANKVKEFRYRIEGEDVVEYDLLHASPTISRDDGTFGFGQLSFQEDFDTFQIELNKEIKRVRGLKGLFTAPERPDVIHYSALPWFSFTGLSHPRIYGDGDSIPKICFGKIFEQEQKSFLPLSVQVHHGLVDGFHVALFVEEFSKNLNKKIPFEERDLV